MVSCMYTVASPATRWCSCQEVHTHIENRASLVLTLSGHLTRERLPSTRIRCRWHWHEDYLKCLLQARLRLLCRKMPEVGTRIGTQRGREDTLHTKSRTPYEGVQLELRRVHGNGTMYTCRGHENWLSVWKSVVSTKSTMPCSTHPASTTRSAYQCAQRTRKHQHTLPSTTDTVSTWNSVELRKTKNSSAKASCPTPALKCHPSNQ